MARSLGSSAARSSTGSLVVRGLSWGAGFDDRSGECTRPFYQRARAGFYLRCCSAVHGAGTTTEWSAGGRGEASRVGLGGFLEASRRVRIGGQDFSGHPRPRGSPGEIPGGGPERADRRAGSAAQGPAHRDGPPGSHLTCTLGLKPSLDPRPARRAGGAGRLSGPGFPNPRRRPRQGALSWSRAR